MKEVRKFHPFNYGWIQARLSEDEMNHLWKCIENGGDNFKGNLAGNISVSNLIKDEGNLFFDNVLSKLIASYCDEYPSYIKKVAQNNYLADKPIPLKLRKIWVNKQKQYEFNPVHDHSGLFSFVVWMKIPTDWKDQKEIPIAKESNSSNSISNFQFLYSDIFGNLMQHNIDMSSQREGEIVFFPSPLQHQVYPFYNCEEERISISGNISFDLKLPEPIPPMSEDVKKDSTTPPEWGGWNQVSSSENYSALSEGSNQEKYDKWWNQSDTGFGL
tara:strand:- start:77 stop:892 length:816 start_codon:yes stop_codon:yes gene_type:complete